MLISTKGRYALRVMIDLAEHADLGYIPMKEVARRQDISLKYLERILPILTKNKLIVGVHGKGGGYRLTKVPEDYKVGEILRLVEGDIAPVACLKCGADECGLKDKCRTQHMWNELNSIINNYLNGVTVADLMQDDSLLKGNDCC